MTLTRSSLFFLLIQLSDTRSFPRHSSVLSQNLAKLGIIDLNYRAEKLSDPKVTWFPVVHVYIVGENLPAPFSQRCNTSAVAHPVW